MKALAWAIALAAAGSPPPGPGRAEGRIVRLSGRDTIPVSSLPVVLHKIGPRQQGPIDTVVTDASGRFRFRFTPDTAAAFLLSARYAGIEYFSRPIGAGPAPVDTAIAVLVADTSSVQSVLVRQRTLLISRPDESGTRLVLDWLVLSNPGPLTRIVSDSVHAAWGTLLPEAAQNVEMADNRLSQLSPDVLVFRRDSALVFAPLSPGDKELMLQYRIPGTLRRFVVPAAVSESVFVMTEESDARVVLPEMLAADSQMIEGRVFRRWAGTLAGAATIEVVLDGPRLSSRTLLILLVVAAAAGFALLAWRTLRGRRRTAPLAPDPSMLAAAIARLDARYEGREQVVSPAEWSGFRSERARLKQALEDALARSRR